MAIRFGFNNNKDKDKGEETLSQSWLLSLALVNTHFLKECMVTLTNYAIPSLIIHSTIWIESEYCLFQQPPLHLRSNEIKFIPKENLQLCDDRLESLTVPFSKRTCLAVKGALPCLKTINFVLVGNDELPKLQNTRNNFDMDSNQSLVRPILSSTHIRTYSLDKLQRST
ncbi:hypothetical protein SAMD00019534_116750 [Acytostelium subglobosum LB1]|uniref:hypothetical protein n=1 Tax=Acytostelium subglobosum LB1 TaxID=1410327 RepID=UPI000644BAEB|nr:hypothetical protein SAMD00019534_116750 [Acytostelium subglobosum LB1]GAM28499.1 hypothetical protein SAMD00019534_116750 [Acytostelium subglobosum LB1]|eukprot:XP_012748538.1 hypothetical protein SAMD00019534_116750 [Acytostelium subglobosum LB1]